ncbi:Hypothetical predicted protein, partial [Prunus dulcis]
MLNNQLERFGVTDVIGNPPSLQVRSRFGKEVTGLNCEVNMGQAARLLASVLPNRGERICDTKGSRTRSVVEYACCTRSSPLHDWHGAYRLVGGVSMSHEELSLHDHH